MYVEAHNPEAHNLVVNAAQPTAYPAPMPYAQDYPKSAYYDQQAAHQTHAYAGAGYAAQPFAPQSYGQGQQGQTQQFHQGQQQGYEMTPKNVGAAV
jgi:hypothetical protein